MTAAARFLQPRDENVSKRMRANRKLDSRPELRIRSALHAKGLRFRKNLLLRFAALSVRPDVVFPRRRVAVFVDGCFWHSCPEHGTRPRFNSDYWDAKLARNVDRDRRVDEALVSNGWISVRVWEHELPEVAARRVASVVAAQALR